MPYEFLPSQSTECHLHLWPYRSLTRPGFVWFIGGTAALIAVPMLAVIGSPVLWGLLPFLLAAIAAIWWALQRNLTDTEIVENLALSADKITLVRHGPRGRRQDWQANPHWVQLTLHATSGPVPDYLTLTGNGRQVELGSFLTPAERVALRAELADMLAKIRP